jgi:DNA-binding transcriptional LysR family regulator
MNFERIDLNLFRVFEAVLREGGITAAARTLNLSQPAVSHALARLRETLGDPLFERQGRAMVPTPIARSLAGPIRLALGGLENSLRTLDRFDPATARRRFTVAMRPQLEDQLLPPVIRRLGREAPGIDLTSTAVDWRNMPASLADGTVDLAIDVPGPVGPDIRRRRLRDERTVVIARRGHPLLARGRGGLDLAAYLEAEHIRVSLRRHRPGLEDIELARLGLERRIRLRCQSHSAALRIVSQTDLLLTMAEPYARILNEPFGNRILKAPIPFPPMDSYLYWHAGAEQDPANRWLRRILRAELGVTRAAAAATGGAGATGR